VTIAWSPPGKYLWDFWFARRGAEVHAFYLQADVAACEGDPARRHDLASIGHALRAGGGWKEAPTALEPARSPAWDDLALGAGSVPARPAHGRYALFYTARAIDDALVATPRGPQRPQQIGVALSSDLREWRRPPAGLARPVLPNPGPHQGFDGAVWRDPCVIRDEGLYRAFVATRLHADTGVSDDAGGVIAALASADLESWGAPRAFVRSDDFYELRSPQVFWRRAAGGKRCYLLFAAAEADCSRRRRSRLPAAECRTGTYVMTSDLLPPGFTGLPPLREPARLLVSGLGAGRILDPEVPGRAAFYGVPWADGPAHFPGGIAGPIPALFDARGELSLGDPALPGAALAI
jgi:beta-fructofuranosidase